MRIEPMPASGALLPALDPRRTQEAITQKPTYIFHQGEGTGYEQMLTNRVGLWIARQRIWREEFDRMIGPRIREYWTLWRNFDNGPSPGPQQEWRDRTVIPEAFKIIMTRLPKKVVATWGKPEPFAVEGRGFRDQDYEDMVRDLIATKIDQIGRGLPDADLFMKRVIDGELYGEIMGHVWWKLDWSKVVDWLKTQVPIYDTEGNIQRWQMVELLEQLYEGFDFKWLGLDSIACDLSGANRWKIERVQTSLEALKYEDKKYRAANGGQRLYKNLNLLTMNTGTSPGQQESYEEPRDTEHWPLQQGTLRGDPGETPVELWLCWDNVTRTLTKIANRRVELDHGIAPTFDGRDPYLGVPSVPVPGRVYGESILNWIGPLAAYQTRIARARGDEILINLWSQYIMREGALRSSQLFWRPGGFLTVESEDPSTPVNDLIAMLPRRPVFQEAWQEEGYRQQQAEATAGADALSQGVESTQKSRDVTAAEINQRVMHGANRQMLENLYHEVCFKKPLLQRMFDTLRMNLTQAEQVRILDDQDPESEGETKMVDLRDLDRPVDIVIGGGILEATQAERLAELRELVAMITKPPFLEWAKVRPLMIDLIKTTRTVGKRSKRYVRTEEEVQRERQEKAAAQMALMAAKGGSAPKPPSGAGPEMAKPIGRRPGAEAGGQPPTGQPAGPGGAGPPTGSNRPTEVAETV